MKTQRVLDIPDVGQRPLAPALALDPDPAKALRLAWEQGDTAEEKAGPRQPAPTG